MTKEIDHLTALLTQSMRGRATAWTSTPILDYGAALRGPMASMDNPPEVYGDLESQGIPSHG